MQARILSWLKGIYEKWKGLTRKQQMQIIAVAVVLIAIIIFTTALALKPKMKLLYTASTAQQAAKLKSSLSAGGINSVIANNGSEVHVNQAKYYGALAYIEENNLISDEGFTYRDAFDFSTIGTTESVSAQYFKKAAETDIANMIKRLSGVLDCTVILVVPGETNFWLADPQSVSASVVVTTATKFDTAKGMTIARLVSRSVKDLLLENIEVTDAEWNMLFSGMSTMDNDVSSHREAEMVMSDRMEAQLRKALRPRYDLVIMQGNLVFDWDKILQETIEYTNPTGEDDDTGLIATSDQTNSSYRGTENAAPPGTDSNDMNDMTYQEGDGSESSSQSKTSSTQYYYNMLKAVNEMQIGKFLKDESSLSVYLYNYTVYDEADLSRRGLLEGTTWADFKDTNNVQTPFTVDDETIAAIKLGTGIQDIGVIGITLPQFIDKVTPPARTAEFVSYGVVLLLILMLAFALLKKTQPDEITEMEPTLTVEEMLVSTKQDELEKSEVEKLKEIEFGVESEVRKQISKFVNEKPEAFAQLLRNWLSEDWE